MGNGKENTPVGFLWLIGITDYLKKGLLKELDAEDMAEFIKASTEIRYYKAGADPKFWNEFDEETRSAAINELRQNQCFQELEIMRSAVDMLDRPQEIIQPAQV